MHRNRNGRKTSTLALPASEIAKRMMALPATRMSPAVSSLAVGDPAGVHPRVAQVSDEQAGRIQHEGQAELRRRQPKRADHDVGRAADVAEDDAEHRHGDDREGQRAAVAKDGSVIGGDRGRRDRDATLHGQGFTETPRDEQKRDRPCHGQEHVDHAPAAEAEQQGPDRGRKQRGHQAERRNVGHLLPRGGAPEMIADDGKAERAGTAAQALDETPGEKERQARREDAADAADDIDRASD